jgi:peroxiredoxin
MKRLLAVIPVAVLLAVGPGPARAELKVGDPIPEFKLPYATQDTVVFAGYGSADLKGKTYVIAFYPADWSGGCTKEMCTFRDGIAEFEKLGVVVLPVSADLVFSHRQWAQYHKLPFKLLADQTRAFGTKMGVYMPDVGMMKRSMFVVGPEGRIEYLDYDYSLKDDADLNALKGFLARGK